MKKITAVQCNGIFLSGYLVAIESFQLSDDMKTFHLLCWDLLRWQVKGELIWKIETWKVDDVLRIDFSAAIPNEAFRSPNHKTFF